MLRKRSLVLRSCDASSCTQEISEQKYRQSSQVSMKSEGTCSRTKKCGSSCPTAPRRSCINDLVCWESCHCNSAFVTSHALAQFASLLSMVTATHARVDQHYDVTKRNPLRNVTHLPRLRSTLVFQAVGVCCPTWERPVAKELTHYQRLSPTTPSRTFQERGGGVDFSGNLFEKRQRPLSALSEQFRSRDFLPKQASGRWRRRIRKHEYKNYAASSSTRWRTVTTFATNDVPENARKGRRTVDTGPVTTYVHSHDCKSHLRNGYAQLPKRPSLSANDWLCPHFKTPAPQLKWAWADYGRKDQSLA